MSDNIQIHTEDKLEYHFVVNSSGFVQFRVKARHDAHIALCSQAAEVDPMYEVFIGGWGNTKSIIRKNRTKPDVAEAPTPNILSEGESRGFWIRWNNGSITVGRERESTPFLSWEDNERVNIEYIGVSTGRGATGDWIIQPPQPSAGGGGSRPVAAGRLRWVAASRGQVPPRSFSGGEDNGETVYVIRANFKGGVIPGKLIPSHGKAYVPWGGAENAVQDYEVLCDFPGQWLATSGGNIPPGAEPAGESEDGETLYVGRAVHDGTLTVGKFQPSHGVMYISYGEKEVPFSDFEVLCSAGGGGSRPGAAGRLCWVAASRGQVPPRSFSGGEDNGETVYVIRANFKGGVIPGKLIPSHGQAYVPWGDAENAVQDYEVLCDFPGQWLATSGGNIPPGAEPAGESEDGETLYVGRAVHDGTLTVGKFQPSHGVMYISYGKKEVSFSDFEVLCS